MIDGKRQRGCRLRKHDTRKTFGEQLRQTPRNDQRAVADKTLWFIT